jgi:hypothetical protein
VLPFLVPFHPCVRSIVRCSAKKSRLDAVRQHPLFLPLRHSKGITMQDNIMQAQAQPFLKLVQANMDLLTQFSTSPEVTSHATANASQLFQQGTTSAMKLMHSGAYAQLMQGMLKNYTEFLTEVGQSTMEMMSQGQAAFLRQTQEATDGVIEATETRGRRARQAA